MLKDEIQYKVKKKKKNQRNVYINTKYSRTA
jgi:hypothetical protein